MSENNVQIQIKVEDLATAIIGGIQTAFQQMKQDLQNIAPAAKQAGDAIGNAFNTLGAKSGAQIRAEQDKIIAAFNTIKLSGTASADEIARAESAIIEKLKQIAPAAKQAGNESNKSFGGMYQVLKGIPLLINQTVQMLSMFWQGLQNLAEPAMQLDKLNTQFKAASGSAELAAKDMQFVRKESAALGLEFVGTAQAFSKFAASTRGTSIEGEKAKQVFHGVAEASTALRLSADETNGVLLAFSQMMGKGKISAEELNQVGERLPGALDVMAKSMNMTTTEFRQAAEEGRILSAELMTKVGPALSSLYGDAAKEAANGPAAQLNRLKNAVFELGATIGAGPMKAVGDLASALSWLAEKAREGLAWLTQPQSATASSAFAKSLSNISSVIGFLSAALAAAVLAYSGYTAAAALATTATGAFTIALLSNPIVLAVAAAVVAITAAVISLAEAFDTSAASSAKAGKAAQITTEEQRKAAAEMKQIQDEYDKAFGTSLSRQLQKREQQYKDDLKMLDKKFTNELKLAGDNEVEKQKIVQKHINDRHKLNELYYQGIAKIRDEDRKNEQAAYDARINDYIEFLKLMGRQDDSDDAAFAQKLAKQRQQLLDEFAKREADAKANGTVLVGFEAEKQAAFNNLQKQQFAEAERRGLDRQQRDVALAKKTADLQIAEIKRKVDEHVMSEEAGQAETLKLQEATLRRELKLAKQRATTWSPGSEQYKKALGDIATAEAALTSNLSAQHKQRESARKQSLANELSAAQNSYQSDLNSLQEAENNKTLAREDAHTRRLKLERDYAEQVLAVRNKELADINPETEVARYEAALKAKLEAEKDYQTKRALVLEDESKQFAKQTEDHAKEIATRLEAEKAASEQSIAFAEGFFGAWDAAYNNARESLQELSDAAYNTWAGMHDQPLKTADSIESLRQKAAEAAEAFGEMHRANQETALVMGAGWGDAYKRLGDISVQAQRITADWYAQKVAAEELALAYEKPENATAGFLAKTEEAIKGMNLLDESDLGNLTGAIKKIKDEMLAFTDRVKDALKSLQDEWDSLTLSKLELAEKEYAENKLAWEEDFQEAKRQGNDEAIKALQLQLELMNKIHAANMATLSADPDNSIPTIKRAVGGWIPGTGNSDSVHAMLTPGEFVIRKAAASFFGNDFLHAINNMRLPDMGFKAPVLHFATGGPVPQVQSSGASYVININTTEPVDDSFIRRKVIPELKRCEGRTR